MAKPAMIAAKKIPLPDAERKLKLKMAFSGAAFATTGGIRWTNLSNAWTGIFGAAIPSKNPFTCGRPQMKTMMLRMIQGSQGRRIEDFGLRVADCDESLEI